MLQNKINELEILANYVMENPNQIQATGGNISVKFDNKIMRIKASGRKITDINRADGFVDVNYQKIIKSLNDYNPVGFTNDFNNNNQLNPTISIEVHFHAILKQVVLHTHPIELNSILASSDGSKIIEEIASSINYIPYIKPGVQLGLEVLRLLKLETNKSDNCLVFYLQNHGLIISADTADEVIQESKKIEILVSSFLEEKKVKFNLGCIHDLLNIHEKIFPSDNIYLQNIIQNNSYILNYLATSPDTVIFCGPKPFNVNPKEFKNEINKYIQLFKTYPKIYIYNSKVYFLAHSKRQANMIEEVFLSHLFVVINCPQNINFLTMSEILDLINRDDEKYRLKLTQ